MYQSVSDLYTIFPRWSSADQSWEFINRSQIRECGNWETEHQIIFGNDEAVHPFLGVQKPEPDIYIGSSLALLLQCNQECSYKGLHGIVTGDTSQGLYSYSQLCTLRAPLRTLSLT